MPTVDVKGIALEYVEHGRGTPLVLVHGSASDHRTWHGQHDALREDFRVIAYSRRYHWPSAPIPPGTEYAMTEQVDDLAAVLRALDAAPAHLVGHSYGAFVCLLLAARAPELVRTLVLAEPPVMTLFVSIPPTPAEILGLLLRSPRTALGIVKLGAFGLGPATAAAARGNREDAIRRSGTAILGAEAFRNLSAARLQQVRDNPVSEELLSPTFLPRLAAEHVRGIQTPTLLVGADGSPRVFARLLDHLEALLPHATRTHVPNASHIMHEDNAPAYNRVVRAFLTQER